jgi:hypothetical protein
MSSYILVFLILAVLIVLIAGVFLMGKGGEANKKYANKLMIARVSLQGAVLLVFIIMFFMGVK